MQLLTERLFLIPLQPDGMRALLGLSAAFSASPFTSPSTCAIIYDIKGKRLQLWQFGQSGAQERGKLP